jgi:hypothetical protein
MTRYYYKYKSHCIPILQAHARDALCFSNLLLSHHFTLYFPFYFLPKLSNSSLVLSNKRNIHPPHEERVRAHTNPLLLYALLQLREVGRDGGLWQTSNRTGMCWSVKRSDARPPDTGGRSPENTYEVKI